MRVFISSVIRDFGSYRDAAADGARDLGHDVLRAESLGARDATPEQACLDLARRADVMILLLGARYGVKQRSGLSATHEEYRDARERIPVLVFVQDDVAPESEQLQFVKEVRDWAGGRISGTFTTPATLKPAVTRALHELELSRAAGPADPTEILARATRAMEAVRSRGRHGALVVAVAGGPAQQVVRPARLEDVTFREALLRRASFGPAPIFDSRAATRDRMSSDTLVFEQDRSELHLDASGTVVVHDPTMRTPTPAGLFGGMVIIEEDVREAIALSLRFAGGLLDEIDATHRLTTVAPVASILDVSHAAWRTRAEHAASPNTMSPNIFGPERADACLTPPTRPRAALTYQPDEIADDLLVLLRRQARSRG